MQASSPSILALFNHSTLPSTFFLTCFPSTIQPTLLFCILSKLCSRLVSSIFLSINYSTTISKHEEFSINIKEAYKFFSKEWKKKYDKKRQEVKFRRERRGEEGGKKESVRKEKMDNNRRDIFVGGKNDGRWVRRGGCALGVSRVIKYKVRSFVRPVANNMLSDQW